MIHTVLEVSHIIDIDIDIDSPVTCYNICLPGKGTKGPMSFMVLYG